MSVCFDRRVESTNLRALVAKQGQLSSSSSHLRAEVDASLASARTEHREVDAFRVEMERKGSVLIETEKRESTASKSRDLLKTLACTSTSCAVADSICLPFDLLKVRTLSPLLASPLSRPS
jgi:hypothetical protein